MEVSPVEDAVVSVVCPVTPRVSVTLALVTVNPVAERFVVDALVAVSPVIKALVEKKPEELRLVVEAFVAVSAERKPLVKVKPIPEIAVVLALPKVV